MQHISSASLSDLPSRISYLSSFLDVSASDSEALNAAVPLLKPLIPSILNAVYTKLLSFDITAQAFVPRNSDYTGATVQSVQELTLDHPQIALRKDFLKNYLVKLLTAQDVSPESALWVYMDRVAVMHTGLPGFKHREHKPELRVEYVHMAALLAYVVDLVVGALMEMDDAVVDARMKSRVIRALNKVIWIQNDLFARHFIAEPTNGEVGKAKA